MTGALRFRILQPALALVLCAVLAGCSSAAAGSAPVVDSLSPASGALAGGDTVTLTGSGLGATSAVSFGGVAATGVTVVDDTTVTAVVPHAADYSAGPVDVAATSGSAASAPLSFEYQVVTGVDRQLEYAFEHWDDYNTDDYGDFNDWGGDCQNFVSQTLVARGWETTDDWYNDEQVDWADAFVYAPTFDEWIDTAGVGAERHDLDDRDDVKIGDIVMLDWNDNDSPDHVQVVSGVEVVDGETRILMVGHNLDEDYRDLDEAITVDHPGGTAWFWTLPAD